MGLLVSLFGVAWSFHSFISLVGGCRALDERIPVSGTATDYVERRSHSGLNFGEVFKAPRREVPCDPGTGSDIIRRNLLRLDSGRI